KLSENSEFEVTTPNASCSVRGTTFSVSYDPDTETTTVKVTEGVVKVKGGGDNVRLGAGDEAIVTEDELLLSPANGSNQDYHDGRNGSVEEGGAEHVTEAGDTLKTNAEGFVLFGSYEQDGDESNGPEPIEWRIIDQNENGTLLFSRYVLDGAQYNDERTDVTWATSSLRKWLNSDFYNLAFNQKEQAWINTVTLVNEDNPLFGTPGGEDTNDRVFVLSLSELHHYFYFDSWDAENDSGYCSSLIARGTTHAVHGGVALGVITEGYYNRTLAGKNYGLGCIGMEGSNWWIRNVGGESTLACYVNSDGSTGARGSNSVVTYTHGVRPAIYINW
ncbi:MAG: FecR domain-containing protein, partial [Lachnospiraceae bacterium]|nr:FecR domain-containing protein [Lachnospiraceae bacterium]